MLGDAQIARLSVLCRDILMSVEAGRILSILLSLWMNYLYSLLKYPVFIHLVLQYYVLPMKAHQEVHTAAEDVSPNVSR
jgi:hypothetical protein